VSHGQLYAEEGKRKRAAVAGATGYSGRELIRLLIKHPRLELVALFASPDSRPAPIEQIHPHFSGLLQLDCLPFSIEAIKNAEVDITFLATPNEFSHDVAPELLDLGLTVIDISGAFRLKDAANYPRWYGFEHKRPDLLQEAVYGLTEIAGESLRGARLVANPGCYPTSIELPLIPLLRSGLIDTAQPIICDSKSGVTGAGKTPTANTHFSEVYDSFKAYNLLKHRHTPEIIQCLELDNKAVLIFSPHLLPINQGILSTIYCRLVDGATYGSVRDALRQAYRSHRLIRMFENPQLPEIKFVVNTPFCDIGWVVDQENRQLIIISAIDNLLKGAASQAVQNANVVFGLNEAEGLL